MTEEEKRKEEAHKPHVTKEEERHIWKRAQREVMTQRGEKREKRHTSLP
jgi:hypothetical protein